MAPSFQNFQCTAPSNIAFIKYWGKKDAALQIPANPSLSMTLSQCVTQTSVSLASGAAHQFYFADQLVEPTSTFGAKVYRHLQFLDAYFKEHFAPSSTEKPALLFRSSNTFPTAAGIASSASGLAALTLAYFAGRLQPSLSKETLLAHIPPFIHPTKLALLSKMGSGSSARSFAGPFVYWGADPTTNEETVRAFRPEPILEENKLVDLIAIVNTQEKEVSSSVGHLRASSSPFYPLRQSLLPQRLVAACHHLQTGDWSALGPIIEQEALDLYTTALTSKPAITYPSALTWEVLLKVREIRLQDGIEVYFTVDAGPNVHILCQQNDKALVLKKLECYFADLQIIEDCQGEGPSISPIS